MEAAKRLIGETLFERLLSGAPNAMKKLNFAAIALGVVGESPTGFGAAAIFLNNNLYEANPICSSGR